MIFLAWPDALARLPRRGWGGGPIDDRAAFTPDAGPPLMRRRTTASTHRYDGTLPNLTADLLAVFEAFYEDTLQGGSQPFYWRDPVSDDLRRWVFASGQTYALTARGANLHDVQITVVRLPGTPWVAPYVPDGTLRFPAWVADWDAGVFAVGADRVAAGGLGVIEGPHEIWQVATGGAVTVVTRYVSGTLFDRAELIDPDGLHGGPGVPDDGTITDIPSTAPPGTLRWVGYTVPA